MTDNKKAYGAESIKVLEGLEEVRKNFDVIELSTKIRKKGDILILSKELKIKPRILNSAVNEGRILSLFPNIDKSKTDILCRLKTDLELQFISKKYDIYNTSARKLIKLVKEWNQDIQKNPLILVSQEEHDLIIGSLLGDGSIRQRERNNCFRVSHSLKQEQYINFKLNLLKNFKIAEFSRSKRMIKDKEINMINLATRTHYIFNYYRNLFYESERKIINNKILEQITPRALAFWVCDDGSYNNKQGYIILCTNAFNLVEHELMKEFFNKRFGLNPTIGFRDGKYYYLRFKQEDSKKLIEIIKPFIPQGMEYKIGGIKNV